MQTAQMLTDTSLEGPNFKHVLPHQTQLFTKGEGCKNPTMPYMAIVTSMVKVLTKMHSQNV